MKRYYIWRKTAHYSDQLGSHSGYAGLNAAKEQIVEFQQMDKSEKAEYVILEAKELV